MIRTTGSARKGGPESATIRPSENAMKRAPKPRRKETKNG